MIRVHDKNFGFIKLGGKFEEENFERANYITYYFPNH